MAAVMTPSRARLDGNIAASTMRMSDLPPTMADTLPSIEFGFDKLRRDMATFRVEFDNFVERGRLRIIEERNLFHSQMADIQKQQIATKREIDSVKAESAHHRDLRENEAQEIDEIRDAIAELELQRDNHQARRDEHRKQIAQLQSAVDARKQELQQQQRHLDDQAAQDGPELRFWEESLGLQIQTVGIEDRLKFIFTLRTPNTKRLPMDCSFDLDMTQARYNVLETEPSLDRDAVATVLDRLNESQDLAAFLKRMRALLRQAIAD